MEIDHALIADFAEINGGKLYVMGGGWNALRVPRLPATVRIAVAVGIRFGWEETNRPTPVTITVEDDDGHESVRIEGRVNVGRPPDLPPGTSQLAQLATNIALPIRSPGGYRIRVTAAWEGDTRERTLPFRVVETGGQRSAPGPTA